MVRLLNILEFFAIVESQSSRNTADIPENTVRDFVVNPDRVENKLKDPKFNSRGKNPVTGQKYPKRYLAPLENFLKHDVCRHAQLTKCEVVGLRLYTG